MVKLKVQKGTFDIERSWSACPELRLLALTVLPSDALGSHGRLVAPLHSRSRLSRLLALRKPCGLRAQPVSVSLARVVVDRSSFSNASSLKNVPLYTQEIV